MVPEAHLTITARGYQVSPHLHLRFYMAEVTHPAMECWCMSSMDPNNLNIFPFDLRMFLEYSCGIKKRLRCPLLSGDVLGLLIDLERGKVAFSLNGNAIERDFKAALSG